MHLSKMRRYTLEGFADVKAGDFVLDIGAFVGEFSVPASKKARKVVAAEPDTDSFYCLTHNAHPKENLFCENKLFWEENGEVEFKIGGDPTDNSVINIDSGDAVDKKMEAVTIDSFMRGNNSEEIDFLKVDAEGAEPQVLKGAGETRVKKCAIDCSKEKHGESTKEEVVQILSEWGLEVRVDVGGHEKVVFGREP